MKADIISVYLYGSTIYGTARSRPMSDFDLIAIVNRKDDVTIQSRVIALAQEALNLHHSKFDVNIYTEEEFIRGLEGMEISFLECTNDVHAYGGGTLLFGKKFQMPKINIPVLRDSISRKASNSWVKAKKKLTVQEDYDLNIGRKSAWHSLRIINFGIQLATLGKIEDIGSMNLEFFEIMQCNTWQEIDENFRKVYNNLSTEFRKVAPK